MATVTRVKKDDIVISVSGGCVTGVFTDILNANIILVDWDNLCDVMEGDKKGGKVKDWPFPMYRMPPDTREAYQGS